MTRSSSKTVIYAALAATSWWPLQSSRRPLTLVAPLCSASSAVDSDNQLLLLLGIRHPTREINVIWGRRGRHGRTGNYSCLSARYLVSSNDGPANVVLSRQKNGAPFNRTVTTSKPPLAPHYANRSPAATLPKH
jgi:hypothetical protein